MQKEDKQESKMVGSISYQQGNILQHSHSPSIIAHGCNCEGFMHRGLANSVREMYPDLYREYERQCRQHKTFTVGSAFVYHSKRDDCTIINLGTQQTRWSGARPAFIRRSLQKGIQIVRVQMKLSDQDVLTIAIPKIGCTHGKLNWERDVLPVVEDIANEHHVHFVVYDYPHKIHK